MWICLLHRTNLSMGTPLLPRGAGDSRAFVPCDPAQDRGTGRWQLGLACAIRSHKDTQHPQIVTAREQHLPLLPMVPRARGDCQTLEHCPGLGT